MSRLVVSGREVIKVLSKIGFQIKSQKGSHVKLIKDNKTVIVPVHHNDPLTPGTLSSIIRQSGLDKKEFHNLFK